MAQAYRQAIGRLLNKEADLDTDTLKITLHTSTYSPNLDTHDYVNDLTNELSTASGYTSGGLTLSTPSITYTAANSWATARANSTAYAAGDVVRPASGNGFLYRCITAGTSAGSIPTYPTTVGATVTDGSVTWTTAGSGVTVFDAVDPSWSPTATFTGVRYAVISDRTPGTAATQPLIALIDFGSNQAALGGVFTINFATGGILQIFS